MSRSSGTFTRSHRAFFEFFRRLFCLGFAALGGVEVVGAERVPAFGSVILCPNHRSLADPWLMLAACPRPYRSMAARELFQIPGLKWFLLGMAAFPVTRGELDVGAIREARRYLDGGDVVQIFPEGRCSTTGEQLPTLGGAAMLAVGSQSIIVPVAIRNSHKLLPIGAFLPRRQRVTIEFGEPLIPTARRGRQAVEELRILLDQRLRTLVSRG